MSIRIGTLNGKRLSYTSNTEFLVQTGRGRGTYKTRNNITGSLASAVMYYNGYNIGNGYKKRLIMIDGRERRVLAKYKS